MLHGKYKNILNKYDLIMVILSLMGTLGLERMRLKARVPVHWCLPEASQCMELEIPVFAEIQC